MKQTRQLRPISLLSLLLTATLLLLVSLFLPETVQADTLPLHVSGTKLYDSSNQPVQLRGTSTHGINFGEMEGYVNKQGFQTLRDSYGINTIRLAMYTEEWGGYCSTPGNQSHLKSLIDTGVNACRDLNMYVIIDWHVMNSDSNPKRHQNEAISFFEEMSRKYASYNNVLYEICNEPCNGTSWSDIKSYADAVIPTIRRHAPNSVILVGTPNWSQNVDEVAAAPVANPANVMYSVHFYAASPFHRGDDTSSGSIISRARRALASGTPIFITEFSICESSGSGNINYQSAEAWKTFIMENNLSYCAWSLSHKETSSLFKTSCSKLSGWTDSDLSETGRWFFSMTRSAAPAQTPKPAADPVDSQKTNASYVYMYRLYNPNSGEHFYTKNQNERDHLKGLGWHYEGIGWNAPVKSNTPVYRLYNPNAGDHHYTTSLAEKNYLDRIGWNYEGVGWYSDDQKTVPLYRQYNPNAQSGAHNFTTSLAENNHLKAVGWRAEGIAWYGVKAS